MTGHAAHLGFAHLALPDGTHDFTIAEAGDHLTAQLAGQRSVPLHFFGNHTFGVDFDPGMRLIFAMDGARASKLTLHQGGGEYEGARK